MTPSETLALIRKTWPTQRDRLANGFYTIKDKAGNAIPFRMNAQQAEFYDNRHGFDLILKARQYGFTTLIQLLMLDECLFKANTNAGVIAHTLDDAKSFFKDKIRYAYEKLPAAVQELFAVTEYTAQSMRLANGSFIRVGTSLRSGTYQWLHVSEFGKICARMPDKATEIQSGAFNTVQAGQNIIVESTAEGAFGAFHDMVRRAEKHGDEGLTNMDFKLHFFPWHHSPDYEIDGEVTFTQEQKDYFAKLAEQEIHLTRPQRVWYAKKSEQMNNDDDLIKREFPATIDEAFQASVAGSYFAPQIRQARKEKRICRVPIEALPVHTYWDLGRNDFTVIWFIQFVGPEVRVIDYYENREQEPFYYVGIVQSKPYQYAEHVLPHDGEHIRMGMNSKSLKMQFTDAGLKNVRCNARIDRKINAINEGRTFLRRCWFDAERCATGIAHLENYRKQWDDKLATWKDEPFHDDASHGADAFMEAAVAAPAATHKSKQVDLNVIRKAPPLRLGNTRAARL